MERSLIDCLERSAAERGDSIAFSFEEGEAGSAWLTYGDLYRRARTIAAMVSEVARTGDTVLLLYPQGLELISAFLGCLMAGVVSVPMFPPKLNRADPRLQGIIKDAQPKVVLTHEQVFARRAKYCRHLPELAALCWLDSSAAPSGNAPAAVSYRPAKDSLAFLQYTSGSTGTPRGVMVSHGNLLANLEDIDRGSLHTCDSILVSWLPFYHDMGLIYGLLMPLYKDFVCHLMAPAFVLQNPLLWLDAISRYRATHSAAPNFAYDLCARTITPQQSAGLDLSCWKTAGNGAEPIHRDTLDRFAAAFRPCGFDPRAFCPCYGLAEATLKVAAIRRDEEPVYVQVDRHALERHRFALADPVDPSDPADAGATTLVSCGASEIATRIRIVNPDTGRCSADDEIGEIWVSGETVARGYWRCPEETRATFSAHLADTGEGPFLRTGDLGILHDGGLLVTGRLKDLLIFRGANHYPSDIETTVSRCHAALRPDATAAFAVTAGGEERLVIVQEVERSALRRLDVNAVVGAVCAAVALDHGLQVHALVLLRPMSIPKTSSGKIQRRACREDYLAERLHAAASWSRRLAETVETPESPAAARSAAPIAAAARPELSAIEAWLVERLAGQLGLPQEDLDVGEPLARYGLGSSDAVRLSAALADWLGFPVPPTIAYDHPTIGSLAAYLSGAAASLQTPESARPRLAEPIAIIGIGCRFPGADGPDAFWQLLANGVDAISEVPPERWDAAAHFDPEGRQPGRTRTRFGGFLRGVERFDAAFFGISPHEAKRVDPQQRLLLEVAWEALEHAGLAADRLAGSATGVFVGVCANDYARFQTADISQIDGHAGTGNALSLTANRLSYALDLRGPSIALDTACSSSLVALHQACLSLRTGECETALAGGVNLTLTPHSTIAFSRAGMLAADGRCKTFDAAADGYVRGEGCGLVVLRRLGDALAAGDRVLAVIRGSAVNQDGRTNGLAAPNRQAQEAVIASALRQAGVAPSTIDYVEAHGTGTPLGDPIEVSALKTVLLAGRAPERRCALGSVKTNIGHLEAAAGIAGVIKTVLALNHELIPPHLHLTRLNEQISFAGTPLYVPTRAVPWIRGTQPRRAGVSSFGFGGTNAHVILEEGPALARPPTLATLTATAATATVRTWHVLSLSAKSQGALCDLALRYCALLDQPEPPLLPDLCFSANTGRSLLPYRGAFAVDSPATLLSRLGTLAAGQKRSGVHRGHVRNRRLKMAFLFTGQGSQHAGMGLRLYASQPVFRAALDRCEEILRAAAGFSLLALLGGDPAAGSLRETRYAQPALFALQHALLALWRSWGVTPDAVLGHSVGEYAAAHAAGILTLEDGLALLAARGRLMQEAPGRGAMATVFAGEEQVRTAVAPHAGRISIAAFNGPRHVVVSGDAETVAAVLARLAAQGIKAHGLAASHAFHSPLMACVAEPFARLLAPVELSPAALPLIADLSGEVVERGGSLSAEYWLRHLTEPVRFAAGLGRLVADGYGIFLEVGPSATLSAIARRAAGKDAATWLSSLQPERPEEQTLLDALAALHTLGVAVDWRAFDAPFARQRIALPTYPFERQAYWFDAPLEARPTADPAVPAISADRHAVILEHLRDATGKLLELAPSTIDAETPFLELGADSIVLVSLVRNIEETYAIELPVRLFFEEAHSLSRLAAYLAEHTTAVPPAAAASAMPAAAGSTSRPQTAGQGTETPAEDSELGRLLQRQLDVVSQLMEQQLAALAGAARTASTAPGAAGIARFGGIAAPTSLARPAFAMGGPAEEQRALTPRQLCYVDDLAQRLCRRTPSSREDAHRHRRHWADLRMVSGFRPETKEMCFPIVGERSDGAHVWDREGNEYVDLAMGFGVNLCGHNPPFVMAALRAQLERGIHLGVQSDLAGEVAARIAAMTGMERVTFCNSGTEAVMTAIRLARAATGRVRIVQFSGSYHGHADPTLAVARPGEDARLGADPMAAGVPESTSRQVIVLPYGEERALGTIEALLPELAAVLVEPVQSRRPDLQPVGFLRQLRALTREAEVPLLFDEVITGFRCHPGGAQALFGVEADLAAYGKVLGGGMPIGVVAGRRRFLDRVDGGLWSYGDASRPATETSFVAGTFCKHPLAMAATLAVLRHLEAAGPALQSELNERTAVFAAALNDDFRAAAVPIEVVSFASMFRFVLAGNGSYLYQPLEMDLFFQALVAHGVYVWEGRTCFLSTAHTSEDLRRVTAAARQSVEELRAAGFFAEPPAPRRAATPLPAAPPPVRVPLSEAQQQLWMISRLGDSGSLAYTVSITLQLQGELATAALGRAVRGLVARHEALRTVFTADGGQQVILPDAGITLQEVDFERFPDPGAALAAWWNEQAAQPFDLDGKPLFRAALLALAHDRHLLVLAAHHLVVDGWSMGVLVKDLLELYAADLAGIPAQLEATLGWRDYLLWQQRQQEMPAMAEHGAFWRAQLEKGRPDLDLPPDHRRPARKSFRGARVTGQLDPRLTRELRRQSRQRRCTLFMTLFGAWSSFLARRAGQSRLTLGIPTSGRPRQAEGTVGYCSHLLPIGVEVDGAESFAGYLTRTRDLLLNAYQHQDYPFARLLQELEQAPDPGRTPLLAATFNLERPVRLPAVPGLRLALAPQPILATGFDLHFNVVDWDDRLTLELDYTTDLFVRSTAERLLAGFLGWLQAALAQPDERLERLPAMTAAERHLALVEWNDSGVVASASAPAAHFAIHDVIGRQAELRREAPALAFAGAALTYGELEERANQLAHHLIARGVTPGMHVGLAVPRSPALIVALLGVLKAGAAYVPLDPALPPERLAFVLEDSGASFVVTADAAAQALPRGRWEAVSMDAEAAAIARRPPAPPGLPVGSRDAAYLIYTSGSTGRPKGVVVDHGAILNLAQAQRRLFDVRPQSRVLQFANLGFDASVSEIFVTLAAGATLVLAPPDDLMPGVPLVDLLRRERITLITLPPAVLAVLPAAALPALATVVSAGEACTSEIVARWAAGRRLINAYGPTEACVCATGTARGAGQSEGTPPIGRPIDNVRVYLLDAAGELVPPGAPGEIHIGGAQVARGYWNDPAATAASFLPDPASAGGRLYRTGDRGRHLADGAVDFLGRRDHQVKLRGIRIEPGEIEQTLLRDPGVRAAVVVLRTGRLVAYLERNDPALTVARVRDRLAEALPAPMIPTDFVLLAALPVNANGKVDRDRLPAPDAAAQARRRVEYVAPRTHIEEKLAAIWQEVLEIGQVGVHDDFLSLGGHSLLSIKIAARIEQTFAVRISLKVIFSGETLAELAREVEAALFATSSDLDVEAAIRELESQPDDELASLLVEA